MGFVRLVYFPNLVSDPKPEPDPETSTDKYTLKMPHPQKCVHIKFQC